MGHPHPDPLPSRERGLGWGKVPQGRGDYAEGRSCQGEGTMHHRKHFPRERDLTFFLNFPLPFAGEESEGEGAILLPLSGSPSP